ncbi:chloride channel CLIC-like protein 1 [Anneissia japonica]|uniref:chloride channel CLIC-like protein 1 n=1 Tax=Anneissia japonica TaxID=1529436 RepID=UPI0014255F83|nr:chloride channel CLIC-like protein 1 [Anneissia japonica]
MELLRSFIAFGIYPLIIVFVCQQRILVEGDSIDGLETDSDVDNQDFVDPFDMGITDNIPKKKVEEFPHPDVFEMQELRTQLELCLADNNILNEKLDIKEKIEDKQSAPQNLKWFPKKKIEDGYFKQFVRHFLESMDCLNYDCLLPSDIVNIYLTSGEVATLRKYVSEKGDTSDALYIMKNMIQSVKHTEYTSYWDRFLSAIGIDEMLFKVIIASVFGLICCVAFEMKTSLTWKNQLLILFVIVFVISVPWNWLQLYQEKLAERHAEMMKQKDIPEYCRSGVELSTWKAIKQFFQKMTIKDECKEYHKRYMIDPILEVSPVKAFTKTVAVLLFAPAGELGKAVAEFHNEFLGNMPKLIWIPAFVSWLLTLAVVLFCLYFGCSRQGNTHPPPAVTQPPSRQMIEEVVQQHLRLEYSTSYHEYTPSPTLPPSTLGSRGNLSLEAENRGRFRRSSDNVDGRQSHRTSEISSTAADQSFTSEISQNSESPTGQYREIVEEVITKLLQTGQLQASPEKKDASPGDVTRSIPVQESSFEQNKESEDPQICLLPSHVENKNRLHETIPELCESSQGNSSEAEQIEEKVETRKDEDVPALDSEKTLSPSNKDLSIDADGDHDDDDDSNKNFDEDDEDDFVVLQSSN